MKTTGKFADELKHLTRRLTRDAKPAVRPTIAPLDALVRAAMSFDMPDARANEAMTAIDEEFCDLNELRVATELEVQELLGAKYPLIKRRVTMITLCLNRIFEREHTLSLERLRTVSKRDARQFLRELPGIHPFVEAYVMLISFDGHAMPLDDLMLEYIRRQDAVDPEIPLEEAQRYLEHHLKAEECFDVYHAIRKASAHSGGEKKKAK